MQRASCKMAPTKVDKARQQRITQGIQAHSEQVQAACPSEQNFAKLCKTWQARTGWVSSRATQPGPNHEGQQGGPSSDQPISVDLDQQTKDGWQASKQVYTSSDTVGRCCAESIVCFRPEVTLALPQGLTFDAARMKVYCRQGGSTSRKHFSSTSATQERHMHSASAHHAGLRHFIERHTEKSVAAAMRFSFSHPLIKLWTKARRSNQFTCCARVQLAAAGWHAPAPEAACVQH